MPRLFVAIDLPDAVRDELARRCSGLPGARWVRRDQMHLTLRFIGEVEDGVAAAVRAALARIQASPFELAVRGVGQFPPRGAARVLWAGLDAPPALLALQGQVEAAVRGLGLPPEDKPFSAHVTLARFKAPPPPAALARFLRQHAGLTSPPFAVGHFTLYSSRLSPAGPDYICEARCPLEPRQSSG